MKNSASLLNKIILLLFCVCINLLTPKNGHAQSLTFSRVLVFNSTSNDTVPNGKVWKIETENNPAYYSSIYNPQRNGCGYTERIDMFFKINDKVNYTDRYIMSSANYSTNTPRSRFPIWLSAGTRLSVDCSDHQLFIIEFNVVP